MLILNRRQAMGGIAALWAAPLLAAEPAAMGWRVATFRADVTPPVGHTLIGGPFKPATEIGDPLYACGVVLVGPDKPIVLAAIDWCEIRNDAYAEWREALAKAAGTTIDRVLVSSVHQHDAPYFDLTAERLLDEHQAGSMCDPAFQRHAVERVADAVRKCLATAKPVTHIGVGQAKVEKVASNRRVLDADGKPTFRRYSACKDEAMRAQGEGTIDPWLKSITFYNGPTPLATITAYSTHPMSHYGRGSVSADFVGLARERRQRDEPQTPQIYFSGCSGDVTAGKYNDGSPEVRGQLTDRMYEGMKAAHAAEQRHALKTVECRSTAMLLPHRDSPQQTEAAMRADLANPKQSFVKRIYGSLGLSSRLRNPEGHDIDLQVVDFGPAMIALLPAESFVAYQLAAQKMRPDVSVMCLGFGECAPGYIPTRQAIAEGYNQEHGYNWVSDEADDIIHNTLREALRAKE